MEKLQDLVLFFTIYSFLGWLLETIYASTKKGKIVNRGFLNGFVCPIYGFGAIIIILASKLITDVFGITYTSSILNLLLSVLLVTILEFITGYILEKIFNCKWWDYSTEPLNIKGYICVKYSLLWGVLAFLLLNVIHPQVESMVSAISATAKVFLIKLVLIGFLIDTFKSVIDALELRKVVLNHSEISTNKYYEKIIQYKRILLAFPRLLKLNANIINRDIRSILNEKIDKIKVEVKTRFL